MQGRAGQSFLLGGRDGEGQWPHIDMMMMSNAGALQIMDQKKDDITYRGKCHMMLGSTC